MKGFKKYILLSGILLILLAGCEDYFVKDKFKRPYWLPGKLYTTVFAQEELSMFAECIKISGLDTILDVSGSWSVFAPTNDAMQLFLTENHYATISDIPIDELRKITEFHVIQNPWSLEQLQILSAYGWRENENGNRQSYAYKRQTILKKENEKYWIKSKLNKEMIVADYTTTNRYKKVISDSRKYVPIFYDRYLAVNNITSDDFRFYFDRDYESGNVYYAGAKIIQSDLLAENGFLHIIDRVVSPMLNAKEMLERELPGETYKLFLDLVYWYYPSFSSNMEATFNQPEVRRGGLIDTLWDLSYNELAFTLHTERTGFEGSNTNESLVRHNGMYIPSDNTFGDFIHGVLTEESGYPHWKDRFSLPMDIVDMIVDNHFKSSPIYPSKNLYQEIFRPIGSSRIREEDIIRKEFGSNCTFIGLDNYIPDPAFTSVTGPVFCRPNFSIFRMAMIYSGAYETISNYDGELYFFPISDGALFPDSSIIVNWIDRDNFRYNLSELNRQRQQIENLGRTTLRNRILNQVGTLVPNENADRITIRTLRGNNITWNLSDNTIQGTRPCTIGYNGIEVTTCYPSQLDEPADNGKVWRVNYWFNF